MIQYCAVKTPQYNEREVRCTKDAILNLKLSRRLHDAVQVEAEKNGISMAAYVRAVLARQLFSNQTQQILGEELIIKDKDGDILLDV